MSQQRRPSRRIRAMVMTVCNAYILTTIFLLFNTQFLLVESSCFFPSGALSSEQPCDTSASQSVCCAAGFYCLGNGLCQDPRYSDPLRLLRGSCTDETWKSPECASVCKTGAQLGLCRRIMNQRC
ncbi:hypothetical protein K432DRAFT_136058 [Lepidopterella palustris CBS 459.81]|uniref:Uncharacterized protein n=1 Tax=Lepidopterella palustris CBS 459.81 TaxID=1314670 RepID=A0A8E2E3M3_9PEZI|nr:hypothetical protein K432DRAFT_136058 [Lepidopterella palustris CBS 459.81]